MADVLNKKQRSRCMAAIRSTDTLPERIVRKLAHSLGIRYRLHAKGLPGKPDLVFPRLRAVIFVHGCFWHQHTCRDGRIPTSRTEYWEPKLYRNRARDKQRQRELRQLGWRVMVIWECQTKSITVLERRLRRFLVVNPLKSSMPGS